MAISKFSNSSIANGFPKYQSTKTRLPVTSNLSIWVDATDAATITESGGSVSQWNDKSGNGINFSQGTSSNRPTISKDSTTGNQFISFDGSNDFLQASSTVLANKSSLTWFVVLKWNSGSAADYEPFMATTNSGSTLDHGAFHYVNPSNYGACYPFYASGNGNYDGNNLYTSGATYIIEAVADGTNYLVSRNGATEGFVTFSGGTGTTTNNALINICYQPQGGTSRWGKFDIGEILIYTAKLSGSEIQSVRTYLNEKWRVY